MTADNRKTVYILGAGFSQPAGGLPQANLLAEMLEPGNSGRRANERDHVTQFLEQTLRFPRDRWSQLVLEDIYTPIDRCLADRVAFRSLPRQKLEEFRDALDYCIAATIAAGFDRKPESEKEYVRRFAKFLVEKASHRARLAADTDDASEAKQYDPFSIISLNWDILLDNAIHSALRDLDERSGIVFGDYDPFGVVDYCCYVSSLDEHDRRIRSGLWSLGARGYNVKLLKPHGSMNWLQCENCQRLYTSFGVKLILGTQEKCHHCEKHGFSAVLRPIMIMPTFLKDLSNFQLKLVWQNASVEIMEARRLVFIGYSLPEADFELRQLLSRMTHEDAQIKVVLYENPQRPELYAAERERYDRFFAGHIIDHEEKGVQKFVEDEVRAFS